MIGLYPLGDAMTKSELFQDDHDLIPSDALVGVNS